jgi:hypothetical protein
LQKNPIGYERFIADINYIPFYKVMDENGDVQAAATKSGLVNQYFSKALKGGEKPFGDLMENTLRNWSHILSASMKNEAANATIRAALDLDGAFPNLKVGLDWRDGKVYSAKTGQLVGDGKLKPEYTTSGKGTIKICAMVLLPEYVFLYQSFMSCDSFIVSNAVLLLKVKGLMRYYWRREGVEV